MKQYEVTFIVDPVLSGDEIKKAAEKYVDHLKSNGCTIVNIDELGLLQLAYPIKRRSSGVYYCVEFQTPTGAMVDPLELALRRDENILRFLTVKLDKFGVKYNQDKRDGKIGKVTPKKKEEKSNERSSRPSRSSKPAPKAEVKKEATAAPVAAAAPEVKVEAPVKEVKVEAPVKEVKVEAPVKEAKVEAPKTAAKDDLKKVEGIGPKIEGLLNEAGINSFAELAGADVEKIREVLAAAGSRYTMHDPATWPKQADMAAAGKWDELKEWQEKSDGGRPVDAAAEEE